MKKRTRITKAALPVGPRRGSNAPPVHVSESVKNLFPVEYLEKLARKIWKQGGPGQRVHVSLVPQQFMSGDASYLVVTTSMRRISIRWNDEI